MGIAAWIGIPLIAALAAAGPAGGETAYTVLPHDTMYSIAQRFGVPLATLAAANGLRDPGRIRAGQLLRIPYATSPVSHQGMVWLRPSPPSREAMVRAAHVFSEPHVIGAFAAVQSGPLVPGGGAGREATAARIISAVIRFLGTPYVFGGNGPGGVDCSGLVHMIYGPYVPHLPRLSYDLWTSGLFVDARNLMPGDLVFFNTNGRGASHVGIYIGNGQFVHPAASAGRVVIDRLGAPYYAARYLGARRVF